LITSHAPFYFPSISFFFRSKERSPSPIIDPSDRDFRTVFVSQLSVQLKPRELAQFFEARVGRVAEVKIIADKYSRKSKG